ncbi:phosphatidate phosphatase PAH2-like [Rutidosis leptorrhynchoides]|uniref:phosphatidate phosphatase PAH2-like n=1 Tax=Rutidosis leptorrhynchoides TaxID=125765 RepID=UPI003A99EBFB
MYAVGRLGSYITQGVYTVSGPFHPFGGAVDMVVVQQQDGSLKSSPWYVRFGKFQGVLKAKERVVDINVNGLDADFHMYLDPRGEAYFLREVDSDEVVEGVSSHSSMCEELNGKGNDKIPIKSKSMNYEFDSNSVSDVSNGAVLSRNNSKRSRILGFVLGRRSMKEPISSIEENDLNVGRMGSLESAEMAADLLEMRWSTNLSSKNNKNVANELRHDNGDVTGGRLETSLVLHEQHFVNKLEGLEVKETIEEDIVNDDVTKEVDDNYVPEESLRSHLDDPNNEPEVGLITAQGSLEIVPESYAEAGCNQEDTYEPNEVRPLFESNGEALLIPQVTEHVVEQPLSFNDLDVPKPSIDTIDLKVNQVGSESMRLTIRTDKDRLKGEFEGINSNIRRCSSNVEIPIPKSFEVAEAEMGQRSKSLPNIRCQYNNVVSDNHEDAQFYSPIGKLRSSWDFLREDASRIRTSNLKSKLAQSANNMSNELKDGSIESGVVDGAGGSWSLWPFRRSGSKIVPDKEQNTKKDSTIVDIVPETDVEKEECSPKLDKMHTRAITPTPEQLASLNLAEGQNTVTFTFSTSVLGPQKVDARIYLWKWDTRIVISDVDGTITKSDVLGQFMPLVGRDWSHIGVTHLFSGIKENGYQMLYLSARAISQASITRQFLFNLKQDGKALPDGPVVISPDGLFPSLFREVIRRAPHEFKIACLEDIKACFPPDRNPFYAGFGNRDTDEFSYLKVGIPKGKIFIINPKGEVVINRCIDSKSYASLHALVNGIFPPISVHEEEDYNSWNFWKLPPPTMD